MSSKYIVLITGGNTGIGYETVKALLRSDRLYHILLASRDIKNAENAIQTVTSEVQSKSTVESLQIDVEEDDSISQAFEKVSSKHPRIDCLINNAGAQYDGDAQAGKMTPRQAWNKGWNTNVTGAHCMTLAFLPLLLKSEDPRLLFITSGLSSLEICSDPTTKYYVVPPAGLPKTASVSSYKCTKAALNMAMIDWTRILKNDGVKVWSIAPGLLATGLATRSEGSADLMRKVGALEPHLGGERICGVVEGKRDADVGKVVREYDSPIQPW